MSSRLVHIGSRGLRNLCQKRCCSTGTSKDGTESEFPKAYEPSVFEDAWIQRWNERKSLTRKNGSNFRMIFPPPNVTGKLHLGHALTLAIQDTIARWKTMQGYKLEWIPGFDHAGIATHTVALRKLKLDKSKTDSEKLQKKIQQFALENLAHIKDQLKSMGALLDWDSSYYTLDELHSSVVEEAFVHLFEAGVIQRGDGMVNWSCALQSSISDIEVDSVDFKGKITLKVPGHTEPVEFGVLHYCSYNFENSDESIIVATSRPETMFGDVAVAVNPGDSRHARFIGRKVVNPVNGNILPVIGDSRVKTDFGSGAVKITPAHDKLDFAIGLSHKLPRLDIISKDGFLTLNGATCQTIMPRLDARKTVLDILSKSGALMNSQEYSGSVNICSRTGDVIELKVLPHWFFKTEQLTKSFVDAVKSNDFVIFPDYQRTDLLNMLSDSQDWCLSRQIKWGHPIPMYQHVDHPEEWVSALDLSTAKKKIENKFGITVQSDSEIVQDTDVLDTWFSSSLIPVALSGWPDVKKLEEISLMETGNDILLYWVWRMVITSLALTNQFPFKHVLLHAIVTDKYGRKMSKSKGNVIDPIHVINGISYDKLIYEANLAFDSGELVSDEYDLKISGIQTDFPQGFKAFGRDALRFALLSQDIQAQQTNLDITYLDNCRHFTNKLWQALRFFTLYRGISQKNSPAVKPPNLSLDSVADLWLLSCLYEFADSTEQYLDKGKFHLYAEAVRKFFYLQLCDVYIELIKHDLKLKKNAEQHLVVLQYVIATGLKLSHPIIPFVTEEMWARLGEEGLLVDQEFPKSRDLEMFYNSKLNLTVLKSMKLVKEIRSLKTRLGMTAKSTPQMFLDIPPSELHSIELMKLHIESLTGCNLTCESPPAAEKSNFITVIFQMDGKICKMSTPKGDATSKYLEVERNKIMKLQIKLAKLKKQYENPNFQQHASQEVKEKLRKRLQTLETQINEVIATTDQT